MTKRKNDSQALTRRGFLKAVGMAAGVGGAAAAGLVPAQALAQDPAVMPRRTLGRTGVDVPVLNLGGMFDTINNQLLLKQAVNWGVTYWDTAEVYGNGQSEEGLGRFFGRNPAARKDIFLTTKLVQGKGELEGRFVQCLKRLQTESVDLFYVHAISGLSDITPETLAWVRKLKESGRARFIGFSTHANMAGCLSAAPKAGWVDVVMFTYNFRVMGEADMQSAVDACHKAGIGLVAMKTQGTGSQKAESPAELAMLDAFLKKGFTDKQAKLRAVWADERIATICSQMPNLTILSANVAAARNRTALAAGEAALLDRFAEETRAAYCAGCAGICSRAVGGAVPVGDVMRCLMYHRGYNEPTLAREVFASLPEKARERLDRIDYARAEAACPQGLAIGDLMREAKTLLG